MARHTGSRVSSRGEGINMPRVLEDTDYDLAAEDADVTLSLEEERQAAALGQYQEYKGGDLTDGGDVGGAHLFPTQNGQKQEQCLMVCF